jgi:DNA-binding PucR family transcriptional regulator
MLLTTLEAFLVHGGVIPVVAERLALHRSSVYGRLRRGEGLLGIDLDEGEIRLALHHAIVALRLARAETTQRQM